MSQFTDEQARERWHREWAKCKHDHTDMTAFHVHFGRALLALESEKAEAREVGFRQHKQIDGLLDTIRALEAERDEARAALMTAQDYGIEAADARDRLEARVKVLSDKLRELEQIRDEALSAMASDGADAIGENQVLRSERDAALARVRELETLHHTDTNRHFSDADVARIVARAPVEFECDATAFERLAIDLREARIGCDAARREAEALREQKDDAYAQRNRLALLLAAEHGGSLCRAVPEEPGWTSVLLIPTAAGQLSFHVHDSELPAILSCPAIRQSGEWDGHDDAEKWRRVERASRLAASPSSETKQEEA